MKRIVRPGWNAIDVGANIGVFTVLLAECVGPTGRVLAVEPGSLALDYLRRNIIRSGFLDRVTVCAVAAGKRSGTVQLHVPAHSKNLGGSRIATQAEARTEDEKVPMRTLDAIWEAQGCPRCDFIKTDVEGGERDVLRGAERMFAATPPNACIVEFNTDAPLFDERGATALWNFFATRQYKPFDIRGNPITCRPTESADILFCRQQ